MKKEQVIQIVKVEAGKNPEIMTIKNELEAMQGIVGGWIEVLNIDEGVSIVCNEEGKLDGLPLNRGLRNEEGELWEIIAGTFFVAGDDYSTGEFIGLTDEQAKFYEEKFHFPEAFFVEDGKIRAVKVPAEWIYNMAEGEE